MIFPPMLVIGTLLCFLSCAHTTVGVPHGSDVLLVKRSNRGRSTPSVEAQLAERRARHRSEQGIDPIQSEGWDRADTGAYYGDHEVIEDEDGAVIYVAPRSGNHNPDEYKDFTAYSNYLGQPQYGDEPGVIRDSDGNVVYRGDIEHDPAFYDDNYYDVPTWTQQTFRGSGSGSNETPIYQNADGEIVHIDDPDDAYLFHGNFVWPDQGVDDITQGVSQLPTQVAESSSDDNDGDLDHSRRGSARSAAAATQRQARPRRPNRVRTAAFSSTGRRMTRSRSSAEDESSHGGSGRSAGGSSATSSAIVPYDSLDNDPYAGRY